MAYYHVLAGAVRSLPSFCAARAGSKPSKSHSSQFRLLLIVLLGGFCIGSQGQTYVNRVGGGSIRDVTLDSGTWTAASGPYIIEAQVTIGTGATLTVEPGVAVQVQAGMGIYVSGTLAAKGAAFTVRDTGNWRGIYFGPTASASVLDSCTVRSAGADNLGYIHYGYRRAAIFIDESSPVIKNCVIADSSAYGLELYSSAAILQGNTIENVGDGYFSIVYDTTAAFPVISGTTASGRGLVGILVAGGGLGGTNTWNNPGPGLAYYLNGEISLGSQAKWILDPGVVCKTAGQRVVVDGTLEVNGTPALPVVFTSRNAIPQPGDWKGIYFGPSAANSVLRNLEVLYAGQSNIGYIHYGYRQTGIYLDGCDLRMEGVKVAYSLVNGLELYGASPSLSNLTIQTNGAHGLRAETGSRPTIAQSSFSGNGFGGDGYHVIALESTSVPVPSGVSFEGNRLQGIQVWGGTLGADAEWKNWAFNAPYVVTGNTTVPENVVLTIEPGTVVKLQNSLLWVTGVLHADGGNNRIYFTSFHDDSLGGASDGNIIQTNAAPADWKGIFLSPSSGASILNNCAFRYAGGDNLGYIHYVYRRAAVYADACSPRIIQCEFSDSAGHGIELYSSRALIQNSTFKSMGDGYYPIVFDTLDTVAAFKDNSTSGTGFQGVALPGGSIVGTNQWSRPGPGFPYLMNGSITVDLGAILELEPGTIVQSGAGGLYVHGKLLLPGTSDLPIVWSSRNAQPAAGDWTGFYLGPTAGQSVLRHVTIMNAGKDNLGYIHYGYRSAAFYADMCSPLLDFVTIADSASTGLELYGSSPILSNLAISRAGWHAIRAETGSRPTIQVAHFDENGKAGTGYSVVAFDASSVATISSIGFNSNRVSGVQIWGGTLDLSAVWQNWGIPYLITGSPTVPDGVSLTIEKGTVLKFQGTLLSVSGNLQADGGDRDIIFTSWRDDAVGGDTNADADTTLAEAGNWKGLYLAPTAGKTKLNRCVFKYAGGDNLGYIHYGYRRTSVYVDTCVPSISNCQFMESAGHGLELYSSSATIQSNLFKNLGDGYTALVFDTLDCFPIISGNIAEGKGFLGISVPGGSVATTGQWQKPGTNFPYLLEGNLTIDGNVTLLLTPGVSIQTVSGIYVNGTLMARGSSADPILFSSRSAQPAPGDWRGLYFGPGAGNSSLRFCRFSYAGRDNLGYFNYGYRRTTLYVERSTPELSHLDISQSAVYGIMFYGSNASLDNSLISANASSAVVLMERSNPSLINNTIASNGGSGLECGDGSPLLVNNIVAANARDGISASSGVPVLRKNCVFGNAKMGYAGLPPGGTDLQADPLFVNPSQSNFRLAAASPAANQGDSSVILPTWSDLDGRLRQNGAAVDLGAYESSAAAVSRVVDAYIRNLGEMVFVGTNLYTVESQAKTQTTVANQPAVYEIVVEHRGNITDHIAINAVSAGDTLWTIRYFLGNNDVSRQVTSSEGLVVSNAAPGFSASLRIEVTPSSRAPGDATRAVQIAFRTEHDPGVVDTLMAVTRNTPRLQVDLAVRRDQDLRFLGEGIINTTGSGQTKSLRTEAGRAAVYFVQIANAGNLTDTFLIRASNVPQNWSFSSQDALASGKEIGSDLLAQGWTTAAIEAAASVTIRLEVRGSTNLLPGAVASVLVSASSRADGLRADAAGIITTISPRSTSAHWGTYTVDADFEMGVLAGVEYSSVPDQLQLSVESLTLPFIWVPNSNEGTVSKVDTRTGRELARYRTSLPGAGNPSRTTVDQRGNCWVANRRTGTVVKLGLWEASQYVDRNTNGIIETSIDLNGDGEITGEELLPWGKDECVLFEVLLVPGQEATFQPGAFTGTYPNDDWNPGPRGIAVDANDNVWIGTFGTKKFYLLDGATGRIQRTNDVSSVNHTSYGAVVDAQGMVWSSGSDKGHVLRLNPVDGSFTVLPIGHYVYGLGLDQQNHLFVSGWTDGKLSRVNVLTGTKDWTVNGFNESRGIAVTGDGDIWVANSAPGTVTRWSNDGVVKAQIPVGAAPTGVAVDAENKVWVVNNGDEFIKRIDPNTDKVDLSKRIIGGTHYGYSDMTGILARNATTKLGIWTINHDSEFEDSEWGTVSWTAAQPQGTSIRINVRSSGDLVKWSAWEQATNGVPLTATPNGKYFQVEVRMQILMGDLSPILYDLTVKPAEVVETTGLVITSLGEGRIRLWWPSPGFVLQRAGALGGMPNWIDVSATSVVISGGYGVTLDAISGSGFFRLRNE